MQELAPRLYLIRRLREELLGPRGGPDESLPLTTDPREEYTTGVLDISGHTEGEREIEELEALEEEPNIEPDGRPDDEESADPLLLAGSLAPSVDPRRLPGSIGLTFFVSSDDNATLDICLSGGRYRDTAEGWQRESFALVYSLAGDSWAGEQMNRQFGVRLVVRTRPAPEGLTRVSVFLVNAGGWEGQGKKRASRFLYQPQIRVCLGRGARLAYMSWAHDTKPPTEEERLQMLYRDLPVLGRGHMCAAVWQEIDIEQQQGSPFLWCDSRPECERFQRCDIRTDLMPAITVPTPSAEWREEFGPAPVLSALTLSELPIDQVGRALRPLTAAYSAWIRSLASEIEGLPEGMQDIARQQLADCQNSLRRMEAGITLLESDPPVHLAFCFANRAVHEQASWGGGRALSWRPFQLGFMLQCLSGLADSKSQEREICDLLWFPTGGGKTEAYLGLTALTLGLRRLRGQGYDGVGVISRYTLRLLSIQQFRRALKLVTACEMLRVEGSGESFGWRPGWYAEPVDWLWGRHRFSAGLWLGSGVTPNQLEGNKFMNLHGAFDLLEESLSGESEPAQITECPVCAAMLVVPEAKREDGVSELELHLRVRGFESMPPLEALSTSKVQVLRADAKRLSEQVHSLVFELRAPKEEGALDVDVWWSYRREELGQECQEICVRASRPGYYIEEARGPRGKKQKQRIEIFCPNPDCATARSPWCELLPMAESGTAGECRRAPEAVALEPGSVWARQIPIPGVTVDDQIYAWPPSLLISTVDKFARLAFESRAASLFGNVEHYHALEGFYREGCLRKEGGAKRKTAHPAGDKWRVAVGPLPPPDLIIQDELHLIDGPLGSMVGLYETAVSHLCGGDHRLKYVASTATVREASDQVQALFARQLNQFPPAGLNAGDSFFALMRPGELGQRSGPGRLYMAYSAPGRGALTPQVRAWAVLLQAAEDLRAEGCPLAELDPYWTPVGYFTTIRSLASTASLWRQPIRLRLEHLAGDKRRELAEPLELSSRVSSGRLPGMLGKLDRSMPEAVDGVLSTSMFGTGVDVSRLSLMLVQGQPKTTSSYIQATGRVGRQSPALILTLLPATNPRALDHFEFFTGYHRHLYRGVEPVTVFPFAPRARERALGPLCVALLRQMRGVSRDWRDQSEGALKMANGWDHEEVKRLLQVFLDRAKMQPELRRPEEAILLKEVEQTLQSWRSAAAGQADLLLDESTLVKRPEHPVVLGTPQHTAARLEVVYPNAPQSLREIEPTTGFRI